MNKKFFTLLVAFLATISFGAFAQGPDYGITATNATEFTDGQDYLIKVNADKYLKVNNKGELVVVDLSTIDTFAKLDSVSWTIKVDAATETSPVPNRTTMTYTNVATGKVLGLNKKTIIDLADIDMKPGDNKLVSTNAMSIWIGSKNISTEPVTDFYYVSDKDNAVVSMYLHGDSIMPVRYGNIAALTAAAGDEADIATITNGVAWLTPQLAAPAFPAKLADGLYILEVLESNNATKYPAGIAKMTLGGTIEISAEPRLAPQHMPSAQWALKTATVVGDPVNYVTTIQNREFETKTETGNIYAVRDGKSVLILDQNGSSYDSVYVKTTLVTDPNKTSKTVGYWNHGTKNPENMTLSFRYLHELAMNKPVYLKDGSLYVNPADVSEDFNLMVVPGATADPIYPSKYGIDVTDYAANTNLKNVGQLERTAYYMGKKTQKSLLGNPTWKFVTYDPISKKYSLTEEIEVDEAGAWKAALGTTVNPVPFFLKENYETEESETIEAACYYVLLHANTDWEWKGDYVAEPYAMSKISVSPNTLVLTNGNLDDVANNEVANSAFKLTDGEKIQHGYRKLGRDMLAGEIEKTGLDTVKIYRAYQANRPYLYEDANSNYSTTPLGPNTPAKDRVAGEYQINFLGIEGKGDTPSSSLILREIRGVEMPQYLISVAETEHEATAGKMCPVCQAIVDAGGVRPENCPHDIKPGDAYITGRFLVNLTDSVFGVGNDPYHDVISDTRFAWENKYVRLAFVDATLFNTTDEDGVNKVTLVIGENEIDITPVKFDKDNLEKEVEGLYSPVLFSFRFINPETNDFLIETESWVEGAICKPFAGTIYPNEQDGGWLKYQNGVPVIVNGHVTSESYEQAEVFNWETTQENPTSNTGITEGKFDVTAGFGTITIKGAAGKQVVVTNILGKAVATVTLGSDYETISVPAGVVVISVDGEATKALVK